MLVAPSTTGRAGRRWRTGQQCVGARSDRISSRSRHRHTDLMSGLPIGTVTFAFSDIEGSTSLLKALGDRYGDVLSGHRRLMRKSFTSHGGVEIDTQGDAFFFAFPRARDAVSAAVEAQRMHAAHSWPGGHQVRVRMGLHTGEPAVGSEGYHGIDVVRAARLCTIARGGQVILSETTRALVGGSLPDGVAVHMLGERRLKDIEEPERVFELEISDAATPAPPVTPPEPPAAASVPEPGKDDFGAKLSQRIQEHVQRKIEGRVERVLSDIDALADRAAENPRELLKKLDTD
jgi:class 3 adenylate cyclase